MLYTWNHEVKFKENYYQETDVTKLQVEEL